jgi:predicted DNA-binding ribbon-helix-helix protein
MITPKNILLIDIDYDYENFMNHLKDFYVKHVNDLLFRYGLLVEHIEFKKSSSGNTHVMIKLNREIDYHLMLRLMLSLGCDLGLVSISLMRLKAFGDPLIKQFQFKERKRFYMRNPKIISFRAEKSLLDKIRLEAEKRNMSVSKLIRLALESYINNNNTNSNSNITTTTSNSNGIKKKYVFLEI